MQPLEDMREKHTTSTLGWMEVLAIVIIFATLSFGGFLWWPVLVVIVFIACITLLYYRNYRGV